MDEKVLRFNPKRNYSGDKPMYVSDVGNYVKYTDYKNAVDKLEIQERELTRIYLELQELKHGKSI